MWTEGSIRVRNSTFHYWVKHYEEPSEDFGIDLSAEQAGGGRISKLTLKQNGETVYNYDRGLDVKPTDEDTEIALAIRRTTIMIKGIDVSSWQGNIDFAKVKASGIDFVIIRAGYGRETRQNDNCFELNYRNAKAAGLDVGAYWYSYADSAEDAVKEARACMEVIKGKKFEYPIYFDLEEQSQFAKGRNFCDSVIKAFCGELEKNGYLAGLYCSTYYLNNYISNTVAGKYELWVAQYNYRCTYTANKYGIWQYSSEGRINGISGNVDMDYCYTDYPAIVKNGGNNGYKKTTAKKTTTTATKAKKTVDELAKEVIAGKWSAGEERKQKLTAAGYDYSKVQAKVNELMAKPTLKSVDEIAKEVIQGKWSNGDERKTKLNSAGYDYGKVQARVNELMKNQ